MKLKKRYFKYLSLIILLFSFLFIQACSNTISPDGSTINKTDEILNDEMVAALAEIEKPISKDLVVEKAESHFTELSAKVPRFAGYYLDKQNERHVGDDKLVVLLTGKGNLETALSNIQSHISSRFNKSIPGHKTSDIIIKEAKYNFRQLLGIYYISLPLIQKELQ